MAKKTDENIPAAHLCENEEKRRIILDAAQKRFGLYGLSKTTMQEIADDLNISKASLYYYFPDKESLYAAVIKTEQEEYIKRINNKVLKYEDPCDMLRGYIAIRQNYFRTLLNLSRSRYEEMKGVKPFLEKNIKGFKEQERAIINKILASGVEKKKFNMDSTEEMASLYLALITGLFHFRIRKKDIFYLDKDEFSSLVKESNLFTEVFLRGLQFKLKIN